VANFLCAIYEVCELVKYIGGVLLYSIPSAIMLDTAMKAKSRGDQQNGCCCWKGELNIFSSLKIFFLFLGVLAVFYMFGSL